MPLPDMWVPDIKESKSPIEIRENSLIIHRFRKTIEIPSTNIDELHFEIKINAASYSFSEYYVMTIYLKNGQTYDVYLRSKEEFEYIYRWMRRKGMIDAEKERKFIGKYNDWVMEGMERSLKKRNVFSVLSFAVFSIITYATLQYAPAHKDFLDILELSLAIGFLMSLAFLLFSTLLSGSKWRGRIKSLIYRKDLFERVFEEDSGVRIDFSKMSRYKRRFFRAPAILSGIFGVFLLIIVFSAMLGEGGNPMAVLAPLTLFMLSAAFWKFARE